MKTMKPMILAVIMGLQMNGAFAQENNVVEQINITSDAVKVALEEFSTSSGSELLSNDAEVKINEFNKKAQAALTKYETDIRLRVLSSFTALVNQYNSVVKNQSLGNSRREILDNLLSQLKHMAEDKSDTYRTTYLELFSVLPEIPVLYDYKSYHGTEFYNTFDSRQDNPLCMDSFTNCSYYNIYKYSGDLYFSSGKKLNIDFASRVSYYESGARQLFEDQKITSKDEVKSKILKGCYTNTCFYQMLTKYTVWTSMIKSSLAREITISLDDGASISITTNTDRNGDSVYVVDQYLTGIETEGLINNLPYEISEERLSILSEVNKELQGRGNCRTIKKLKERLCQETSEGCLQNSEVELFKDRFNSKISCLAK